MVKQPIIPKQIYDALSKTTSSPISAVSLELQEKIRQQIQNDGLYETFVGYFEQSDVKGKKRVTSPLVIAQTEQERGLLEQGRFVGKSYGLDGIAEVEGTFDGEKLQFVKRNGDARILYDGSNYDQPEGYYPGKWRFETTTDGTLASEGSFFLTRVNKK